MEGAGSEEWLTHTSRVLLPGGTPWKRASRSLSSPGGSWVSGVSPQWAELVEGGHWGQDVGGSGARASPHWECRWQ